MSSLKKNHDGDAIDKSAYNRHKKFVEEVKNAYVSNTKDVFDQLSPDSFEPFSEVLRKMEGRQLSTLLLIDALKTQMTEWLNELTNHFFSMHDLESKLITLEVLKERFKDYEGTTWNVHNMKPNERTSKIRMLLKQRCIAAMDQQLMSREAELAAVFNKNKTIRECVKEIKNKRLLMSNEIETTTAFYGDIKPKLMELNRQMNEKYKNDLLASINMNDETETVIDD